MHENEINTLRKKCNLQVEKILSLESEKKELENSNVELRKENKELKDKLEHLKDCENFERDSLEEKSELMEFFKNCLVLMENLKEDAVFIPYKNQSKNSSQYYKIEKETFERYIRELPGVDFKKFVKQCVQLSFFKREAGGNYIFKNSKQRVYFLSKGLVDAV